MKKNESKDSSSWLWIIVVAVIAGYFFHWDVYFRKVSDQEAETLETIYDTLYYATWEYTQGEYVRDGYKEECIDIAAEEAEKLKDEGIVKSIYKNDDYVEMEFKSGLKYIYAPRLEGEDSLGVSDDVEILTYQPCRDTYSSTVSMEMSYPYNAAQSLAEISSSWNYTSQLTNAQVTPSSIGKMGKNQVIFWHGHGIYLEDAGPVLQLGEKFDLEKYKTDKNYQKKYNYDELYVTGDNDVVATPKFFKKYLNSLKNSVVYLGTCYSGYTDELAKVFLNKGAVAVIANSDSIRTAYNLQIMKSVAGYLVQRDSSGSYMDLESALSNAKNDWGSDDSVSFGGIGAKPVIYGGSDARSFRITEDTSNASSYTEPTITVVPTITVAPIITEAPAEDPQELYNAFLSANVSNCYYAFADMNGDGINELLVAQSASELISESDSSGTRCQFADVYTIQNGSVTYAGNIGSSMDDLSYNSFNHSVETYWGGSGYSQFVFYTIDNNGRLVTNYLTCHIDDNTYYYGEGDVSSENSIDESTYDSYYNLWNSYQYISFQWR